MSDGSQEPTPGRAEQPRTSSGHGPRPSRLHLIGVEVVMWLRTLGSAAVYATLVVTFGLQVARVEGRSMEPTLHDQDRLIVDKLSYRLHDPEVGDVVMLLHPNDPSQSLVKRVVAEPGDTVAFRKGVLIRNGVQTDEEFVPADLRSFEDRVEVAVPEGFYFVLGDHRNNSSDSRTFGPVPKKYIIGRIRVRWWPFEAARSFEP